MSWKPRASDFAYICAWSRECVAKRSSRGTRAQRGCQTTFAWQKCSQVKPRAPPPVTPAVYVCVSAQCKPPWLHTWTGATDLRETVSAEPVHLQKTQSGSEDRCSQEMWPQPDLKSAKYIYFPLPDKMTQRLNLKSGFLSSSSRLPSQSSASPLPARAPLSKQLVNRWAMINLS